MENSGFTKRGMMMAVYKWYGFGALAIVGTLVGTVSADQATPTTQVKTGLINFGMVGITFVLIGLLMLLFSIYQFRKENTNVR